jgi:hypothetical protein
MKVSVWNRWRIKRGIGKEHICLSKWQHGHVILPIWALHTIWREMESNRLNWDMMVLIWGRQLTGRLTHRYGRIWYRLIKLLGPSVRPNWEWKTQVWGTLSLAQGDECVVLINTLVGSQSHIDS